MHSTSNISRSSMGVGVLDEVPESCLAISKAELYFQKKPDREPQVVFWNANVAVTDSLPTSKFGTNVMESQWTDLVRLSPVSYI